MVPFADLFSFSFLFSCSLGPVQTAPSLAGGGGMAVGVPALPQYGRIRDWVDIFTPTLTAVLYQSAEWLTLKGFPNRPRHDSRWQTEGVCHGPRYSGADGLYRRRGSPLCPASERRCAGATAVSNCGRARGGLAGRGGEDWRHGSSDAAGLGDPVQRAGSGRSHQYSYPGDCPSSTLFIRPFS